MFFFFAVVVEKWGTKNNNINLIRFSSLVLHSAYRIYIILCQKKTKKHGTRVN